MNHPHYCYGFYSLTYYYLHCDCVFCCPFEFHVCLFQDFGDYQDGYYSVQTTEGEQIAQLIAGYIDIILKKVI